MFEDFETQFKQERKESADAADVFVSACRDGDVQAMLEAVDWLNETTNGWPLAMKRASRLSEVSPAITSAFLKVWIESKGLAFKVHNRRFVADALWVLLDDGYTGPPIRVYRGTSKKEHRNRTYGFSWSTQCSVARNFANLRGTNGVVLETFAPASAIIMVRENEGYYDEGKVLIDPFAINRVSLCAASSSL
jgi:hypothetical protein